MSFWYIDSCLIVDFGIYAMLDWYGCWFNRIVAFVHVIISTDVFLIDIDHYTVLVQLLILVVKSDCSVNVIIVFMSKRVLKQNGAVIPLLQL